MNRIVSKIYLWCSFGYLIIFFSSHLLHRSNFLSLLSPIWIYGITFICSILQIYLTLQAFQNIKFLTPNQAIFYLLCQCILLALFLNIFPILNTNLIIGMGHEAFLVLSTLFACFGIISYFFNVDLNTTFGVTILSLLSLFLGAMSPCFLHSTFFINKNVSDAMLYSSLLAFFLSTSCSVYIYKGKKEITKEENQKRMAPNYAFLAIFNFTYFILIIGRIVHPKSLLKKNNSSKM